MLTSAHLECVLISVIGSSNRYLLTAAVAVAEVSISLGGDMLPAMTSSSWRTSPADDGHDDDDQTTYQFGQLTVSIHGAEPRHAGTGWCLNL